MGDLLDLKELRMLDVVSCDRASVISAGLSTANGLYRCVRCQASKLEYIPIDSCVFLC
jgi:hypothetical protein